MQKQQIFTTDYGRSALFRNLLLGDPLCKLYLDTAPNYYFLKEDISVLNPQNESEIYDNDSRAIISGISRNNGISAGEPSNIILIRTYNGLSGHVKL